jgi:hypothetical protein
MEPIIQPVEREILEKELNDDTFVRKTNNGNNLIYIFTSGQAPNLMREVGRLREITFRDAGGGTGKSLDVDKFDFGEKPFTQLIVWNPVDKEIVGGYRIGFGRDLRLDDDGEVHSPTAELFKYSDRFIREFMPVGIELGRSFVQPGYQPQYNLRKGMYSLDNLWDGLGAIVIDHPEIKYLFGKVTMYPHYDSLARDLVLYFMKRFFPDPDKLMTPRESLPIITDEKILEGFFRGKTYEEGYRMLVQKVRTLNENIPPLVNAYMSLSATMRTCGTSLNREFGNVEETGIIIIVSDIYDFKKDRHIASYKKD